MSELTTKILESGLVDEATAKLMERWGYLPEGASDLARKNYLSNATREQLIAFAERIGDEADKVRRLKETMLDLNQLRWHVDVEVRGRPKGSAELTDKATIFIAALPAVIDRLGRYYFRPQDLPKGVLIPGYLIDREVASDGKTLKRRQETILEVSELFVGDELAAVQVTTQFLKELPCGDM